MEGEELEGKRIRLIFSGKELKMDEVIRSYEIRSQMVVQVFINN